MTPAQIRTAVDARLASYLPTIQSMQDTYATNHGGVLDVRLVNDDWCSLVKDHGVNHSIHPANTPPNPANLGLANPEFSRNISLSPPQPLEVPNGGNLRPSQLGPTVPFSGHTRSSGMSFPVPILNVLQLRPLKEMKWIPARGVIATMQGAQPAKWPIDRFVGETVSQAVPPINLENTITFVVGEPSPVPTIFDISNIEQRPKIAPSVLRVMVMPRYESGWSAGDHSGGEIGALGERSQLAATTLTKTGWLDCRTDQSTLSHRAFMAPDETPWFSLDNTEIPISLAGKSRKQPATTLAIAIGNGLAKRNQVIHASDYATRCNMSVS